MDALLLLTGLVIYPGIMTLCINFNVFCEEYSVAVFLAYPLSLVAQTASVWTCVAIIVDRYVAVNYPLRSRRLLSVTRARRILCAITALTLCYRSPSFAELEYRNVSWAMANHDWQGHLARRDWSTNELYMHVQTLLYATFMFIVPFTLMAVLNLLVASKVRAARSQNNGALRSSRVIDEREYRCTIMSLLIVVTFFAFNLPSTLCYLFIDDSHTGPTPAWQYILISTSNTLVCVNSAVNVLIYCMGVRFRQEFMWLYCPCLAPMYRPDIASHTITQLTNMHALLSVFVANTQAAGNATAVKCPNCRHLASTKLIQNSP